VPHATVKAMLIKELSRNANIELLGNTAKPKAI
jgi:hypothetical protein